MKVTTEKRRLRKNAIKHQNRAVKKVTFKEALKHVSNDLPSNR